MLRAFLPHLARPDACLDFADVGPVQKQHAEAGLADTAADGQRKLAIQEHPVVGQILPLFAAGLHKLFHQGLLVHADAHAGDFQRTV